MTSAMAQPATTTVQATTSYRAKSLNSSISFFASSAPAPSSSTFHRAAEMPP